MCSRKTFTSIILESKQHAPVPKFVFVGYSIVSPQLIHASQSRSISFSSS